MASSSEDSIDLDLSASQKCAWREIVDLGRSGMLSGSAGTGKSFLMEQAVAELKRRGRNVAITATTGIAAVLCGGVTVNSFFRITPQDTGPKARETVVNRAKDNPFFKKMLRGLHCLVVDEASMLSVELFEQMDLICRAIRTRSLPFGGLQVLLVGDFFQLPPVSTSGAAKYIFESTVFWESMSCLWDLKEVWRQSDPTFCGILSRMRMAENTAEDIELLKQRVGKKGDGDIKPTRMFAKRVDVDAINRGELAKLEGETCTYKVEQHYFADGVKAKAKPGSKRKREQFTEAKQKLVESFQARLLKDLNFEDTVDLKVGAQVMLAMNLDTKSGLANGTRGVVVGFRESKVPDASIDDVEQRGDTTYYPAGVKLPIVDFGSRRIVVPYGRWSRVIADLCELVVYHIPLRLAWASTIHRVQGQTLDLVEALLDSSVFEVGQAYVAVSRARSLDGLGFTAFDASVIRADPRVKEFYSRPFETQRRERLRGALDDFVVEDSE